MINITLIKYPVNNLGPGPRIAIWTSGCHKNCKNCMSPHTREFSEETLREVEDVLKEIDEIKSKNEVSGITISGGEPFDQKDLIELVKGLNERGFDDILIYSGYVFEELQEHVEILKRIAVLIDGPYVDELNDDKPLRGSSNQRIIVLNKKFEEKYAEYLKKPRTFDMYFEGYQFMVVGLLPKGGYEFIQKLKNGKNA